MTKENPQDHLTSKEFLDSVAFRTEQWKMWKFLQGVVEFRRARLKRAEAVAQMAYWSGLDHAVCDLMLDGMVKESRKILLKSKPKLTLVWDN
jgi:hypothetical protein